MSISADKPLPDFEYYQVQGGFSVSEPDRMYVRIRSISSQWQEVPQSIIRKLERIAEVGGFPTDEQGQKALFLSLLAEHATEAEYVDFEPVVKLLPR